MIIKLKTTTNFEIPHTMLLELGVSSEDSLNCQIIDKSIVLTPILENKTSQESFFFRKGK